MEELHLTNDEFYLLDYYLLRIGIVHSESKLYFTPDKEKLIKYYTYFNKKYLEQKQKNVTLLNAFDAEHHIDGFVIPRGNFYIDDRFRGIVLPIIHGVNASIYLNSNKCPLNVKIEILKQVGKMLEEIKDYGANYNLAFSDVHADNFIVDGVYKDHLDDISKVKVYGIDTDSCRILDSDYGINDFLYHNHWISNYDKYEFDNHNNILTNYDTDIYCFIIMILKTIFEENIYKLSLDELKQYYDYLDKLGVSNNLLEALSSIYSKDHNINPMNYLDDLKVLEPHLQKKLTLKR
jgi:hypothetical protein